MSFSSRTELLIGEQGVARLAKTKIAVFGIGGVGGAACEALARSGIGGLHLYDDDRVSESNLNRQVVALRSVLGRRKVEVMAEKIADINPACEVVCHPVFYLPENAAGYPLEGYDYIIDAIDTVSAKLELIQRASDVGVPVISAMGAGNKLHPELFRVDIIEKTSVCPLARVMRRELKRRGLRKVKVVYSTEQPIPQKEVAESAEIVEGRPGNPKKISPGSIGFVPAAAGLVLAGAVVRDLLGLE